MGETLQDVGPLAPESALPRAGEVSPVVLGAQRKRVVIVGGGFAGIAAAHALRHADAEVVLIDRRNHHIFQPLLYQVATAVLSPAEIAAPIRQLEAKQRNVSVLLAEITGVDVASRTIEAAPATARSRSTIWWSRPVCVQATSATTSSRGLRRGSRISPTLRRSEPKSWARSNWPQ
jgi:NADH:ubiquinone reductase (H+-translocating)